MATLLDLSQKGDRLLGALIGRINAIVGVAPYLLAGATADGITRIAAAMQTPGGKDAVNLRIAEQYIIQFGNLAKETNTLILPQNLSDIGGVVAGLAKILDGSKTPAQASAAPVPPPLR